MSVYTGISMLVYVLLIFGVSGLAFGVICKLLADAKGYRNGFWWGFFLGLIGLLVIAFRPDRGAKARAAGEEAEAGDSWVCACGAMNSAAVPYCLSCGRKRKGPAQAGGQAEGQDDALERLSRLHQQGLLSDEEFQKKVAELLSKA